MLQPWHFYLMVCLYVLAGSLHFIVPKLYLRIMPRYLPWPKFMVATSGLAEILLASGLCFPETRTASIYGIIGMLVLFLQVHIYMLANRKAAAGLPGWLLWLRLPMQLALIYWAYYYLK